VLEGRGRHTYWFWHSGMNRLQSLPKTENSSVLTSAYQACYLGTETDGMSKTYCCIFQTLDDGQSSYISLNVIITYHCPIVLYSQ
jgi:hypothetical protein